jgi:hypothetical protein
MKLAISVCENVFFWTHLHTLSSWLGNAASLGEQQQEGTEMNKRKYCSWHGWDIMSRNEIMAICL